MRPCPSTTSTRKSTRSVCGYVRTLAVFKHSAKLDVQLPVAWSHFEGTVAGELRTRSPSGLADPRLRFMVNFVGAPALAGAEYGTYRPRYGDRGRVSRSRVAPRAIRPRPADQPRGSNALVVPARDRPIAQAGARLRRARHRCLGVHAQRRLLRGYDPRAGPALLRRRETSSTTSGAADVWLSVNYGYASGWRDDPRGRGQAGYPDQQPGGRHPRPSRGPGRVAQAHLLRTAS